MATSLVARGLLTAALVAGVSAASAFTPASVGHGATSAILGPCWLTKLGIGLGEDLGVRAYVTRWRAGTAVTMVKGVAPHARAWSLTLYHVRRGRIVSFYDRQFASRPGLPFALTIGRLKPAAGGVWIDPTTGGADDEGYLFFRVYKPVGQTTLPSVTFASQQPLPRAASSCRAVSTDLRAALTRADRAHPSQDQTVGQTAKRSLWSQRDPFHAWSDAVTAAAMVPSKDLSPVPLITQLVDPNVVYHAVFFNVSQNDLVMHGSLPTISPQAPATGMRYFSICAYPTNETNQALSCLNDSTMRTDKHHVYTIVVSPDQPADTSNWLNPGDVSVGAIIMRWLLPKGGANAPFCLPALADRQPTDTAVPPLPAGC